MDSHTYPRLVGDIGGTNARFAWVDRPGAVPADVATYAAAGFPTLLDAMKRYLAEHGKPSPHWCAIGIANPVVGDRVQMTNHHWSFSISEVQRDLGVARFLVVNDFTALALSLPLLGPDDLRQVGGRAPVAGAPCGLIGPGTGLGVSGLLPTLDGNDAIPLNGEGGHVSLPAADDREAAVIAQLRGRFGHVSAERAVSGPGLVNLYLAVCALDRATPRPLEAAEVARQAICGDDPQCREALALFCGFLGCVAGNLALTLGARGGMFIGGGIVPKLGDAFVQSPFRERFDSKGRFRDYLSAIPVYVVQAAAPGLLGAARALDALPEARAA